MQIETKFDIDQTVFFMFKNKVKSSVIATMKISIGKTVSICCNSFKDGASIWETEEPLNEEDLFSSKEELLASL